MNYKVISDQVLFFNTFDSVKSYCTSHSFYKVIKLSNNKEVKREMIFA